MVKYNFLPSRIWNTDKTSILTMLAPPKVVAVRGLKQVQKIVPQERGVNTTIIAFLSASGANIPLVSLGCPIRLGGLTKTLLKIAKHFVECKMCSTPNPHLLLIENHSSNLDQEVIRNAK
jgi:hypothetical protein